jgi:hypothetical protein
MTRSGGEHDDFFSLFLRTEVPFDLDKYGPRLRRFLRGDSNAAGGMRKGRIQGGGDEMR